MIVQIAAGLVHMALQESEAFILDLLQDTLEEACEVGTP